MSNKPVLCIQVHEEIQLRLLEERHVQDYFTLIERNTEHLHILMEHETSERRQMRPRKGCRKSLIVDSRVGLEPLANGNTR